MGNDPLQTIMWLLVVATVIGLIVLFFVVLNFWRVAATKDEVVELEDRMDEKFENERTIARESNGKIHARLDQQSASFSELIGETRSVAKNVEKLIERALNESS